MLKPKFYDWDSDLGILAQSTFWTGAVCSKVILVWDLNLGVHSHFLVIPVLLSKGVSLGLYSATGAHDSLGFWHQFL